MANAQNIDYINTSPSVPGTWFRNSTGFGDNNIADTYRSSVNSLPYGVFVINSGTDDTIANVASTDIGDMLLGVAMQDSQGRYTANNTSDNPYEILGFNINDYVPVAKTGAIVVRKDSASTTLTKGGTRLRIIHSGASTKVGYVTDSTTNTVQIDTGVRILEVYSDVIAIEIYDVMQLKTSA